MWLKEDIGMESYKEPQPVYLSIRLMRQDSTPTNLVFVVVKPRVQNE